MNQGYMMSITAKNIDTLRAIRLEDIVADLGARHDKYEHRKWHTNRGTLTLCGQKFYNWQCGTGGGGAIDVTMHLMRCDFKAAVSWLSVRYAAIPRSHIIEDTPDCISQKPLQLPTREDRYISRILSYLHQCRSIPLPLIQRTINCGKLYADQKANAVFVLKGKNNAIVGAELRGTSQYKWRGMAPGSKKSLGCFYINTPGSKKIVLCESAIDALSYYALDRQCWAISTAGAHPNPPWLRHFVEQKYEILCGFDADKQGDHMADTMCALYPKVKRIRPQMHDWNDLLQSKSTTNKYFFLPGRNKILSGKNERSIKNNVYLNKSNFG